MTEEDPRRKAKRYRVSWPSRILVPGQKIVPARTKDISVGGLGFELDNSLPVGQEVSIEVSPWVNGQQYVIRAKGSITYSMILNGSTGFSHGLKFTMVPREQFEVLKKILSNLD